MLTNVGVPSPILSCEPKPTCSHCSPSRWSHLDRRHTTLRGLSQQRSSSLARVPTCSVLVGRPLAGFVQQDEATAFFVWTSAYRAPLRHELAHLYTFQRWGQPPAGAAATWLVEGIGAWAGGPCL
jgi:hypothetical protein